MASRLQQTRKHWQEEADACDKLIFSPQINEAVTLQHVLKEVAVKPASELIPLFTEQIDERIDVLITDIDLPRSWAEVIVKLQAMERPKIITPNSWQDIQAALNQLTRDDFGLLKLIINHDWSLFDIFGCNKVTPLVRFELMGLLLLLHQGDEVVGVNKQRLKILKKSGSKLIFNRSLQPTGESVLLHELAL